MNRMVGFVLCMLIMMLVVTSGDACLNKPGKMTGASCSIEDLNNLYEKNTAKAKVITTDRENRNLRPVKIQDKSTEPDVGAYPMGCRFGICIPNLFSRPID